MSPSRQSRNQIKIFSSGGSYNATLRSKLPAFVAMGFTTAEQARYDLPTPAEACFAKAGTRARLWRENLGISVLSGQSMVNSDQNT